MSATAIVIRTHGRLFLREPARVFFALVFPALLLLVVGYVMPGMSEPMVDAGAIYTGLRPIDIYLPAVLALSIGTVSLVTFPPNFGVYREKGVLRRLALTPMPASLLIVAEIVANLAALIGGVILALVAGVVLLDIPAPEQPLVVIAAFLIGAVQMMGLGALIAALAPSSGAATGIGMIAYFPMLFFAGIWIPGPAMSDTLQTISTFVPLGAVAQAMTTGWFETGFPTLQFVVMVVWTVVSLALATRLFRWT